MQISWRVLPETAVNCYLHSSGISHKNKTLSRVCYFIEYKDFSDVREVRRLLKTWTKVVTCRLSQQSSIKSRELLETKERPFQFDGSWESSLDSQLESLFSILARIENQASTYFWTVLYVYISKSPLYCTRILFQSTVCTCQGIWLKKV